MTIQEKLRALLPEDKASAADDLFAEMDEMFKKNAEDIRKWKEKAREKDGAGSEEVVALEKQIAELNSQLKRKDAEVKDYTAKLSQIQGAKDSLIAERELRKALAAYTIAPDSTEEVYSLLARNVKVTDGNVLGVVNVDGKEETRSVQDTVKHWMETSGLAKRVLVAGKTSGTGAPGSGSGGGVVTKKWTEMSLSEQTALFRQNPEQAKQLMGSK